MDEEAQSGDLGLEDLELGDEEFLETPVEEGAGEEAPESESSVFDDETATDFSDKILGAESEEVDFDASMLEEEAGSAETEEEDFEAATDVLEEAAIGEESEVTGAESVFESEDQKRTDAMEEDFGDIELEHPEGETAEGEDETLKNLEAEIESAVSALSDEELAEELDEATLLDIVNAEEMEDEVAVEGAEEDEFGNLDEMELKAALGEIDEIEPAAAAEMETAAPEEPEEPAAAAAPAMSASEGLEALQTLVKALENEDVVKSLKGMNISINITFGDKD